MIDTDEREIKKTLDELEKRAEEFQTGKMHTTEGSFSSVNLKLILTIIGVGVILIASVFFYVKNSGNKIDTNEDYRSAVFIHHSFLI